MYFNCLVVARESEMLFLGSHESPRRCGTSELIDQNDERSEPSTKLARQGPYNESLCTITGLELIWVSSKSHRFRRFLAVFLHLHQVFCCSHEIASVRPRNWCFVLFSMN